MSDPPILPGCTVFPPMEGGHASEPPQVEQPEADAGKGATAGQRKAAAGRFAVLNGFVDCSMGDLSRAEIAVWLVLYRDVRSGSARTSQANIALRAGIDIRTVGRALRRLEKRGLLKCVYRGGLNRGASRYRVIGENNKPPERLRTPAP